MNMDNIFCHHEHLSFVRTVSEDTLTRIKEEKNGREIEEKELEKRDEGGEIVCRKMKFINEDSCSCTDNFLNYRSVPTMLTVLLSLLSVL